MKTLDQIGLQYRTDKTSPYHNYTPVYDHWFTPYRERNIVILEIGLGDINSLNREGESLYMWRDYFSNARIVGIDIDENKLYHQREEKAIGKNERIYTTVCDQTDKKGLENLIFQHGNPTIIIDDGSHISTKTIDSFNILFPLLKSGGLYCIEDTVAPAYWESWGGQETIFDSMFMKYFFVLTHFINLERKENFPNPPVIETQDWVKKIESIHFYRSQIIIKKK